MWQTLVEKVSSPWLVVGFLGQVLFGGRFLVQWVCSERRGESVIPIAFWYLSLAGSLVLLTYAVRQVDPVFVLGLSLNCVVYVRNLMLIRKKRLAERGG